jgi:predicted dehydrogenase
MNAQANNAVPPKTTRRQWLSRCGSLLGGGAALAALDIGRAAYAAGEETIRFGLVGCGNRGTGACRDVLETRGPVKLVALADLFAGPIERGLANLTKYPQLKPRIDVPPDRRFVGWDAYQKLLDAGVDLVLLATPPHFRPMHYAAAVKAGKHVFLEKPGCVDAPGYRMLLAANQQAKAQRLSVGVGLQRRHQQNYLEGVRKIRDGELGTVQFIRTYFNVSGTRAAATRKRVPGLAAMSEMEYQLRSWNLFCWLSGDHLVEQACHEIDVANWVMGGPPLRANGLGGRQQRTGPGTGDIYDHHSVEFEYAGGVFHFCQARQQLGTWGEVSDHVHGTRGKLMIGSGPWGLGEANPRTLRSKEFSGRNPYQREQDDLLESIRGSGPHVFEGDYGAASSMTAVLGRMATYSGQMVTWEAATASPLRLAPERYALDAAPPTRPDAEGTYPAAVPGVSKAF